MATKRVQLTITDQRFFDDAQNKREAVRVWSAPFKLPYYIENWDAQNEQARVWVKVPKIPANSSVDLYIYYGNPSAVSESDGEAVFEFFDDFEYDDGTWTLFGLNSEKSYEIGTNLVKDSVILSDVSDNDGVATDGTYLYVSHDYDLYKYDMNGNLIKHVTAPFGGYNLAFGGLFLYNGYLWGVIGKYDSPYQAVIVKIDPDTLDVLETHDISSELNYSANAIFWYNGQCYVGETGSIKGVTKRIVRLTSDWKFDKVVYSRENDPSYGWQDATVFRDKIYVTGHDGTVFVFKYDEQDDVLVVDRTYDTDGDISEGISSFDDKFVVWSHDSSAIMYAHEESLLHLPTLSSNVGGMDEGVYADVVIDVSTVIEAKMKIVKSVDTGVTGIFLTDLDMPSYDEAPTDSFFAFGATNNGKFGIVDWAFDNSPGTVTSLIEFPADYSSFHVWTIKKSGNTYTLYYDNTEKGSVTRNSQPKDYLIFGTGYSGNELWVDWVRVRKYAEQEPIVVVGEEEASDVPGWLYRRKVTIHNPNDYDLEHFQVAIDLDGSNFDFIKANADGSDIRIAYASARYSLPYYIETWDTSTPRAVIWVGIDNETRFFVELNPANTTDESDPTVMDLPEATNYTLIKFERYTGGG